MATIYDSETDVVLGNADLSVGSGQLGKAVFLNLAADTTADSLGTVYDSYVIESSLDINFDLPTATSGYKARVSNTGTFVLTIRTNSGSPIRDLQPNTASWFQLTSPPGPQTWSTVGGSTLNDAYKAGANGIILRDAARQAVKVSSVVVPALSDSLLAATALRGGLEASSLEVGIDYVELLCANGAGVLGKDGFNLAIDASLPASSSGSIVSRVSLGGPATDSLVVGPMTLPHSIGDSVVLAPGGALDMQTTAASTSVVIAPGGTITQNSAPIATPHNNVMVTAGGSLDYDSIIEGTIVGPNNIFNTPAADYTNITLVGSGNSFAANLNQLNLTAVGNNNNISGTRASNGTIIMGVENSINNSPGSPFIIGRLNDIISVAPRNAVPRVFSNQTTYSASSADCAPIGIANNSSVDGLTFCAMLLDRSNVLNTSNGATSALVGSLINTVTQANVTSIFGVSNTISAGNQNRVAILGNDLTMGNLNNQSATMLGNRASTTKRSSLVMKADYNATGLPTVAETGLTNARSTAVVFARDFRWSDSDSGFNNAVTVDLAQEGTSGSTTSFDGVFQHKRMFPRATIATVTTSNVSLTNPLTASDQSLGVELKISILEPATGNSMYYSAVVNYYAQGGTKLVSPPITNTFSRISPSPTVAFTVVDGGATYTPVVQISNPTANPVDFTMIVDFTQIRA